MREFGVPLVLLTALGCEPKPVVIENHNTSAADESTSAADESTSGADDGPSDGGDGDGDYGDCGELPSRCCWPQQYLPGECECVASDAPCYHYDNCAPADGVTTCDDLCVQIGRACVAQGCAGGATTVLGTGPNLSDCPNAANYAISTSQGCDEAIPVAVPGTVVTCCCTH